MKILFINLPYHGHVTPTIGLVQELIKQGCDVTYLMPYDWEEKIRESGAVFSGYRGTDNYYLLSEQTKRAYDAAEKIIDSFDLVIYEQFFFLGKHLAEKHGKPVVRIVTAPVANDALMREYITAPGPLSIFKYKLISKIYTKDLARGIPLKTDTWLYEIVHNPPALNLVYTLREYQPYEEEFPEEQYKFLGPSIYERKTGSFDFVKGEKPVVYISLGTIVKGSTSFFKSCIEAFGNEDIDVIISAGKKFNIKRLKHIPSNIRIYNSVPQLTVLKMADVFVTHGGMNSVSESLVCGVPMVVIPFMADQPVNARCVENIGVGKRLEYKSVNKDTLKAYVLSVLSNAEIKNNLAKVREYIRSAPGNSGGAKAIIDYYETASSNEKPLIEK